MGLGVTLDDLGVLVDLGLKVSGFEGLGLKVYGLKRQTSNAPESLHYHFSSGAYPKCTPSAPKLTMIALTETQGIRAQLLFWVAWHLHRP